MKKFLTFVLRYAPLLAAFATGIQAIPELRNFGLWVLAFTGIFGITPDPNFNSSEFGIQLALLVGSLNKLSRILLAALRAY